MAVCLTCGQVPGTTPNCPDCKRARAAQPAPTPAPFVDRRDPSRQEPIPGGQRANDPPLTTRACADWMGVTTEYIRQAIDSGELEAETIPTSGKRVMHRVHLDKFIEYLKKIGWKRIPTLPRNNGAAAILVLLQEVFRWLLPMLPIPPLG